MTRTLPERCACDNLAAIRARVLPFLPVALGGVSSFMGCGPYMWRLSAKTSFAPAAAAPSITASVIGGNSSGHLE